MTIIYLRNTGVVASSHCDDLLPQRHRAVYDIDYITHVHRSTDRYTCTFTPRGTENANKQFLTVFHALKLLLQHPNSSLDYTKVLFAQNTV